LAANQQKSMLVITRCIIQANGRITVDNSQKYELMLNPKSMTKDNKITYNKNNPFGITGINQKFDAIQPENIRFTFTIDGTGVVKQITSVADELKNLCKVVYNYDGDKHEPNHVRIVWGELKFNGRMTNMDVGYTLFLPNGDPLRADVTLAFSSFVTSQEEKLRANRNSPDLSHMVEVRAGDTLPLLCYRIYNDCSYYREVARVNNIINIRDLKPGARLHFPPLR
jgi:Contractile injection system tube protein